MRTASRWNRRGSISTASSPRSWPASPTSPRSRPFSKRARFGAEVKASLTWFPLDELRLAWEVLLTLGDYDEQYRTIVDAATGEVLFCKQLVHTVLGRGNVYRVDGGRARELVDFPIAIDAHGLPLPPRLPDGFPDHWIDADAAEGNAVFAHLNDAGPTLAGRRRTACSSSTPPTRPATTRRCSTSSTTAASCTTSSTCWVPGGRRQLPAGRTSAAAASRAIASTRAPIPGRVQGTANMSTPVDGLEPDDEDGPGDSTDRHTAFDSTVVFHEFMHGISNRLVGGPMNVHALDDAAEQRDGRRLERLRRVHDQRRRHPRATGS